MAEIKLTTAFTAEVDSFRSAGARLSEVNTYSTSKGELSLPTVDAYLERLHQIELTVLCLKLLTGKDAKDMDALAARLTQADNS